jgi:hypothetical protein
MTAGEQRFWSGIDLLVPLMAEILEGRAVSAYDTSVAPNPEPVTTAQGNYGPEAG